MLLGLACVAIEGEVRSPTSALAQLGPSSTAGPAVPMVTRWAAPPYLPMPLPSMGGGSGGGGGGGGGSGCGRAGAGSSGSDCKPMPPPAGGFIGPEVADGTEEVEVDADFVRRCLSAYLCEPGSALSQQFWRAVGSSAHCPPSTRIRTDPGRRLDSRSEEELCAAFEFVRHTLPEAAFKAFLAFGEGTGTGAPGFETYISVAVAQSLSCFLCGGKGSSANPVNVGELAKARMSWKNGGRDVYSRRYASFRCPEGATKHVCRTVVLDIFAATSHPSAPDKLDDMARCYPIDRLDVYLNDGNPVLSTHKRCRGGLLSLLRFLVAKDVAPPVKRLRVGFVCRLCGDHAGSPPEERLFLDVRNAASMCLQEMHMCSSEMPCFSPDALAVPTVHAPCRNGFKRLFHLKDSDLLPELHCCWDLAVVMDSLGIRVDPSGAVGFVPVKEPLVCMPCLSSMEQLCRVILGFKHRREATRVMRSYVNDVVWRGVADSRQRALRAVLYRAPFRIRSPMDMVQRAQALSRQILACVSDELVRAGEAAVSDPERLQFIAFTQAMCAPAGDVSDLSDA